MNHHDVCDARSYLQFRAEWKAVYVHLTEMIRSAKLVRACDAIEQGHADSKVATVERRNPNDETRMKRLEKFRKRAMRGRRRWAASQAVCSTLRHEARHMMYVLDVVKAKRPPRPIKAPSNPL